jgi:undecaprenyl pyrophosphate phosphatase UppP
MAEITQKPPVSKPHSWRLPHRAQAVLVPFFLALFMTLIVSSIATVKAVGLTDDIVLRIALAWATSFVVAFPCVLVILPLVRKLVGRLVEPPPGN